VRFKVDEAARRAPSTLRLFDCGENTCRTGGSEASPYSLRLVPIDAPVSRNLGLFLQRNPPMSKVLSSSSRSPSSEPAS